MRFSRNRTNLPRKYPYLNLCMTAFWLNFLCDFMVLLHVQWIKTTRIKLGSVMCYNMRLYYMRGLGAGPREHKSMIPCLMVRSHLVLLPLVACLRYLLHGARCPHLMKRLKSIRNLLIMPLQIVIYEAHLTPPYFIYMEPMLLGRSGN